MARMHIHISFNNIAESIKFYSSLFRVNPVKEKTDYTKWMLEDPKVNFAISSRGSKTGLDHLGLQAKNESRMQSLRKRIKQADVETFDDGKTVCCYAKSDKSWVKGKDKFNVFSAGSNPTGQVHSTALKTLESKGIKTDGFYSKSWNELEGQEIDVVITVCDNASGESCPIFLEKAIKAHWGVLDPAKFEGTQKEVESEFKRICEITDNLSNTQLQSKLNKIAAYD